LDQLIAVFLRVARDKGFSLSEIQTRLRHWLALQPPDHFLVIEPDGELRRILIKDKYFVRWDWENRKADPSSTFGS
jgi:GntR family transcriptional regulator